jgi:F0F1-type ATP synthase membrane subunit b/b'
LSKVGAWIKDHLTLVVAGVLLIFLIVGFSAGKSDYAAFSRALESVTRYYKKADKKIDEANQAHDDRTERADKKRDAAKRKADEKLDSDNASLDAERERIERQTKHDLVADRDAVAEKLAHDLGVGIVK